MIVRPPAIRSRLASQSILEARAADRRCRHDEALDRRHRDARRQEDGDDEQHDQREALLLDPAAAFDVVDPAEGGVHRAPEGRSDPEPGDDRDDPDLSRVVADLIEARLQRVLLGRGEELLQVAEHARLDVGALAGSGRDEEQQQGEREDREHQVVGDHRRHPGDVLLVGAAPERHPSLPVWAPLTASVTRARPRRAGQPRRVPRRAGPASRPAGDGDARARGKAPRAPARAIRSCGRDGGFGEAPPPPGLVRGWRRARRRWAGSARRGLARTAACAAGCRALRSPSASSAVGRLRDRS